MKFKNITENAVLNAAGRLVDPGKEIFMDVKYYAKHKGFIDAYVKDGKAEVSGIDEYERFISGASSTDEKEENAKEGPAKDEKKDGTDNEVSEGEVSENDEPSEEQVEEGSEKGETPEKESQEKPKRRTRRKTQA